MDLGLLFNHLNPSNPQLESIPKQADKKTKNKKASKQSTSKAGRDMSGENITDALAEVALLRAQLEREVESLQSTQDELFVIISAIGILGLQGGFAMLESGVAKAKNTKAILMKNLLDFVFGVWVWYTIGWGLYQGDNPILSGKPFEFFLQDESNFALFVQQFGFAVTGATIMSGSVLGRMKFELYMPVALLFTGFIYPVIAHWAWTDNGWLNAEFSFKDFAGSGVVHMVGGIYGLIGAWVCGPRVGRFVEQDFGSTKVTVRNQPGHSSTLQTLGLFMLVVGWMFFNAGSTPSTDANGVRLASRALINSVLALSTSSSLVVVLCWMKDRVHHLDRAVNGVLAGLVVITGPCGYVDTWAACLLGGVAAIVYLTTSYIVLYRLHIDDPLDAFAVHGACGAVGLISIGILDRQDGLFYSGNTDLVLGQLVGFGALCAWSFLTASVIFFVLDKIWGISLDEDDQLLGLDIRYHEGYAYPDFSVHDVMEYNRTRDAAVRKMGRRRYGSERAGSESFDYSESSMNSGDNTVAFNTSLGGSSRNLGSTKKATSNRRSVQRKPEDTDDEGHEEGYV